MSKSTVRKLFFFFLRLGFAAVLLIWLVRSGRLDLDSLLGLRPGPREWALLFMGALGVLAGLLVLGVRMRWLLATAGLRVSYAKSLSATVLGTFFGTLLPGLVGGDLVKAAALCEGLPKGRRMAVGAVMADRLVGIYSLFLLAALGVLVGAVTGALPRLPRMLLAVPLLVVVGVPLALVLGRILGGWLASVVPSRITEKIEPLLASLRSLSESPGVLLGTTALGVLNHALIVVGLVAAGEVLGAEILLLDHWILDPLALTLNAVPISPGGLGLAEGAFSYLYDLLGSDQGAAVGVLGRVVQYFVFVATGLLALIFSGNLSGARLEDAKGVQ